MVACIRKLRFNVQKCAGQFAGPRGKMCIYFKEKHQRFFFLKVGTQISLIIILPAWRSQAGID